jgi:allantoate deiminase
MAEGKRASKGSRTQAPPANEPLFGREIVQRLEELANFTDEPGKLTRLTLGPAHKKAADRVASWMRAAGMSARLDAIGNVIGRYAGAPGAKRTLLLGSHIDTVRDAGKYDGNLGVVAAIAIVQRLADAKRRLPFALEIAAFGDEEGVRFPSALTGSRALAGTFDTNWLDEQDQSGISRREALVAFGCDVGRIADEARSPGEMLGYLELHIEQGPVLETANLPVGIVSAIAGVSRGRIAVNGTAAHAGTVPMAMRHDALAAAAEMVLAIESKAASDASLVATVGVLDVTGGAINVIPGAVSFTIDMRSPLDTHRLAAIADLERTFSDIATRRSVEVKTSIGYNAPAAECDARLVGALSAAVARAGLPPSVLPSGAGHDAMAFFGRIPMAMVFVRCRGGVSHNPNEHASSDDIEIGTRILADAIDALAHSETLNLNSAVSG